MSAFEVALFISLWSAFMLAGAVIVDKKKPGAGTPGQDERNR